MKKAIGSKLVTDEYGRTKIVTEWEDCGPGQPPNTFDSMSLHTARRINRVSKYTDDLS